MSGPPKTHDSPSARASSPRLRTLLASAETGFDAFRFGVRRRFRRLRPFVIVPFRSFGSEDVLFVKGRVLEHRAYITGQPPRTLAGHLRYMYQRFQSDEVPGMTVIASYEGADARAVSDEEGYFEAALRPTKPLPSDRVWHDVKLHLEGPNASPGTVEAPVIVPPIEAEFGVISDIDDTIIRTSATNPLKMVRTTLLSKPGTRLPFEGVAAFYLALQRGATGTGHNPIFYVSSSPWNLYDVLARFMDANGIPAGPLLLRDFGLTREYFFAAGHRRHKRARIARLLETYKDLPFILIGDSGQRDPEIYAQIVREYPGRIRAVYIRDVGLEIGTIRTKEYAEMTSREGVPMVLVADTEAAAIHAAENGFIERDALPDIRAEKAKDQSAPGDLAQMLQG